MFSQHTSICYFSSFYLYIFTIPQEGLSIPSITLPRLLLLFTYLFCISTKPEHCNSPLNALYCHSLCYSPNLMQFYLFCTLSRAQRNFSVHTSCDGEIIGKLKHGKNNFKWHCYSQNRSVVRNSDIRWWWWGWNLIQCNVSIENTGRGREEKQVNLSSKSLMN